MVHDFCDFRGSLGNGQKGVFALKKHMGDYELKDSFQALQECLDRFPNIEKDKLFLYGGSHGGFTVTHMGNTFTYLPYKLVWYF